MVSPNVTTPLAVPDECPFGQHGCIPAGCIAAVKPEFYEFPTRATCILDVFTWPPSCFMWNFQDELPKVVKTDVFVNVFLIERSAWSGSKRSIDMET